MHWQDSIGFRPPPPVYSHWKSQIYYMTLFSVVRCDRSSFIDYLATNLLHLYLTYRWTAIKYLLRCFSSIKVRKSQKSEEDKYRKGDTLSKVKERAKKCSSSFLQHWVDFLTFSCKGSTFCLLFGFSPLVTFRAWKVQKAVKKFKKQIDTFADDIAL